ncbi:hypothetical protein [Winogradskyella sp. SYSU M77433]|uniref:hypothetical protein n=1 Tax=Winogradskyella sp. SYSU M77433 TaxID=3042722 RepID=UPI0024803CB7|nr:hypothetical protein [Winogradskyella sp. SYSU M77433]MDH7911520.1 hypothetical protein [Winogradskyella sp. SYSU M77433]
MRRLYYLIKENGLKSIFSQRYHYRHHKNPNTEKKVKFIVFGQGRTGSTLLTKLINQHPKIFCDQEIFGNKKSPIFLSPNKYIESNSRKPETKDVSIYGFKVKIYQLYTDQKISNVKGLLEDLHRKGWKFIFLHREDELAHNVSSFKAFSLGKWFVDKSEDIQNKKDKELYIDPTQFKKSVLWRRKFTNMEKECLENIPHIKVSYEKDLLVSENHQAVCDRIFSFLGVDSYSVKANIKKMNAPDLRNTIKNYDEIESLFQSL